jgi:hypothetical protein
MGVLPQSIGWEEVSFLSSILLLFFCMDMRWNSTKIHESQIACPLLKFWTAFLPNTSVMHFWCASCVVRFETFMATEMKSSQAVGHLNMEYKCGAPFQSFGDLSLPPSSCSILFYCALKYLRNFCLGSFLIFCICSLCKTKEIVWVVGFVAICWLPRQNVCIKNPTTFNTSLLILKHVLALYKVVISVSVYICPKLFWDLRTPPQPTARNCIK